MPLYKKITAVVVFALCGFLGGFISQTQAQVTIAPFYQLNSSASILMCDTWSSCSNTDVYYISTRRPNLSYYYQDSAGTMGVFPGSSVTNSPPTDGTWQISACTGSSFSGSCYRADVVVASGLLTSVTPFQDDFSAPPYTSSTTITSITPTGTIASSSPITITITGALGTDDLASTTDAGNTVRLLSWVGGVDTSFISPSQSWTLSTDGSFIKTYQVTTDLPAGNFKIYASITSAGTYDCSAIDSGGVCVPIGGVNVATTTYFTLNTSYFEHITGTSTPTNLYTPQPCGISDLSGCFQNALAALFYPKSSPGSTFAAISDEARGKFPFIYVYQLGAIRTSLLSASSTAPTGLTVNLWKIPGQATSTIELISQTKVAAVPYSNTIYTVLTWLIWLLMAEYIYLRVIKMHDTHTPS